MYLIYWQLLGQDVLFFLYYHCLSCIYVHCTDFTGIKVSSAVCRRCFNKKIKEGAERMSRLFLLLVDCLLWLTRSCASTNQRTCEIKSITHTQSRMCRIELFRHQHQWLSKPGGRLPLLYARPAVTLATLKRAATNFAAWWTEVRWVWTVCLRLLPDSVATAIWTRALLRLSPAR